MQVQQFIDPQELAVHANYTQADLDSGFMMQPGLMVHYGMMHARALKQAASWKLKVKVVEAKVYNDLKAKYLAEKVKVTEAQLKNEVLTHPDYINVAKGQIQADEELDKCNQAIEAMRQKRDMMVQSAKQMQQEYSNTGSFSSAEEFAGNRMK